MILSSILTRWARKLAGCSSSRGHETLKNTYELGMETLDHSYHDETNEMLADFGLMLNAAKHDSLAHGI